jgi:hypothetical protein
MLRATIWTVGLFGAGAAISQVFPGTWTEPLVLFALGLALLFASARTARVGAAPAQRPASEPPPRDAPAHATPVPAPVTATVHVERTA